MIVEMNKIFPADAPVVLLPRTPPAGPVSDTAGNTFDDKMIVINATLRGLNRGVAIARGPTAPHPFYIAESAARSDVVLFLKGLDDTSK